MIDAGEYKVIRNDGVPYMVCDRETALRLVRQLNERYEGVFQYHAEALTEGGIDERKPDEGADRVRD